MNVKTEALYYCIIPVADRVLANVQWEILDSDDGSDSWDNVSNLWPISSNTEIDDPTHLKILMPMDQAMIDRFTDTLKAIPNLRAYDTVEHTANDALQLYADELLTEELKYDNAL